MRLYTFPNDIILTDLDGNDLMPGLVITQDLIDKFSADGKGMRFDETVEFNNLMELFKANVGMRAFAVRDKPVECVAC